MSSEGLDPRENTREADSRTLAHDVGGLLVFLVISLAVAGLSGIATFSTVDGWYAEAEKTLWNPPNDMFGPVWGVLYTLIWPFRRGWSGEPLWATSGPRRWVSLRANWP